jgi:hypothetical protein
MTPKTPPPWEPLTRALKNVEEALLDLDVVFRGDPALPWYRDYLERKRLEFRARLRRLVERN